MEFDETLANVCSALDVHGIPYMVIGGQAVLFHGFVRVTEDIDITLGISIDDSEKLLNFLSGINCTPLVENPKDFIKSTWVLPVRENTSKVKIDFTFSFSDYEAQAIQNSLSAKVGGKKVRYCSLNDLIVHKIFAGRQRDLDDVRNVFLKNKDEIDLDYIYNWLEELGNSSDKDYVKLLNETIKEL